MFFQRTKYTEKYNSSPKIENYEKLVYSTKNWKSGFIGIDNAKKYMVKNIHLN